MPKMVEQEICGGRLQIGGRWYFNGQHVQLSEDDARVYMARGLTRPAVPKRAPPTDPERQAEAPREVLSPQQVGTITKEEPAAPPPMVAAPPEPTPAPTPAPEIVKEHNNGNKSRKANR